MFIKMMLQTEKIEILKKIITIIKTIYLIITLLDPVVSGDHINNEMADDSINEDDDVNASFSDGSLNLSILNENGGEVEEKPILAVNDADYLDPDGTGAGEHIPG